MKRQPKSVSSIVRAMWGYDNTYAAWDGDEERGVRPRTTPVTRAEMAAKKDFYRRHAARLALAMRASPMGRPQS